jgi:hypothetical protein
MSKGHVDLAQVVWRVDRRSLTSSEYLVWLGLVRDERFSLQQLLTAMLERFWSSDEDEIGPGEMSGVLLVGRTPNWPSLSWFG